MTDEKDRLLQSGDGSKGRPHPTLCPVCADVLRQPLGDCPRHGTPTVLDNTPAAGAPKDWHWGHLPCGCRNNGFGRHL